LSDTTLTLGKKLVAELKLVESTDTLARWMAHYVAELMVRAKSAPLHVRDEAHQSCAQAILDLWEQARAFPAKRSAFESVDRVIETISSLHPDGEPHYRNHLWRALDEDVKIENSEVEELLKAALGIDGLARSLIHHTLALAARAAGRDCGEWLELAQHLEEDDPLTKLRIRIVITGRDEAELNNHRIGELEKRIAQLEHFIAASHLLKSTLEKSLTDAKANSATPDE
jgi:hypothetical protein